MTLKHILKHFQPLSFDSDPSIILIKLKPTQNNLPGLDVVFGAVVLDVPGFENIPQFGMIAWTKLDEFSENFRRGVEGGHFRSKKSCCRLFR